VNVRLGTWQVTQTRKKVVTIAEAKTVEAIAAQQDNVSMLAKALRAFYFRWRISKDHLTLNCHQFSS
jgi:hypothetical protein